MTDAFAHYGNLTQMARQLEAIGPTEKQSLIIMGHSDTTLGVLMTGGKGNYAPPVGYMHYLQTAVRKLGPQILLAARAELEADLGRAQHLASTEMESRK